MNKGMIRISLLSAAFVLMIGSAASADIYKVVDEDGNITFTDQPPGDGTKPMNLPELSVIETDIQTEPEPAAEGAAAEEAAPPSPRQLRKMYSDFRITQPQNDQTFWGTANQVVISWTSSVPPAPEMTVRLVINGEPEVVTGKGSFSLQLDRGEHQVFVELLDARKRRIVSTETVVFFVMQHSQNFGG